MLDSQSGEILLGDERRPASIAMEDGRLRVRVFNTEGGPSLIRTEDVELAHFRGNRNGFTLLRLQHLGSEARLGVGGVTTYSVQLALEDVLFDHLEEIRARQWDLYVEDLAKIVHVTGLQHSILFGENDAVILNWSFQAAAPVVLACPRSRLEVRIGQEMKTAGDPICGPGMTFRYMARCIFDDEMELYPALQFLHRIRLFFSLIMGRVLGVDEASLRIEVDGSPHDARIHGVVPVQRSDTPAERLARFEGPEELASLLDEWLVRFEELSDAIHLHLDGLEQRRLPIQLRFQIFIQALEALHRRTAADETAEPIDVEAVQEALRDRDIAQGVIDRVGGVLAHAHEPGLRQRLRGYWDQFAVELAVMRPELARNVFIGRAVATRNHFAHRTDRDAQVLTGTDLWDWTETIKAISHMALVNEIGGRVAGAGQAMLDRRFAQYAMED